MTILEKLTAMMEQTEVKKFKLQKSILALMLEWKHLEEYMDSTQSSFHQCFDELKRKEDQRVKELELSYKELEERIKKVELREETVMIKEKKLEDFREELSKKEMEFNVFKDARVNELDLRYKELEERIKKVELREEKVKVDFEEYEVKEKGFEAIRKSVGEGIDWLDRRTKELNVKENELEKRIKEIDAKEAVFNRRVLKDNAEGVEQRGNEPVRDEVKAQAMELVAEHKQAPELCRLLGFTGCVPELIRKLVRKNHILTAVRFISEFGLVDEFSPALLLKEYVKHVKMISKKMLRSSKSRSNKNAVIDKRVAALRKVITCILDHKLESIYPPKSIEQSIKDLLKEKGDTKVISMAGDIKKRNIEGQSQEHEETTKRTRLTTEGTHHRSLPHGQGRTHVAGWEYGNGSMGQNITNDAGNLYGGPTNVIPVLPAPMPYLYHPCQQP